MKKIIFITTLLLFAQNASAATLYSQSAQQDVYDGQTFVVDWFLDTENRSINSIDLKLDFNPEVLEVTDVSTGNSLINLWIKAPRADNQKGLIELIGGITNGLNDPKLPIFHSTFKAKKSASATIKLNPNSTLLLNDGLGTSELIKFKDVLFNVYPKDQMPGAILSPTHPDQNSWYSNRNVQIKFIPKADTDYSYVFTSNIDLIPDDLIMAEPDILNYENRPDGIYYFKLNSKVGPSTWQEAGVYRVQIDATPPSDFQPLIGRDPSIFDGSSFISFSTVDKTSGISHYKVKVGLFGKEIETQSPYKLKKPLIGDRVEVTAFDNAGNSTTEYVDWPGYVSTLMFKLLLVFLGLAGLIVNWIVRKQIKNDKKF